MEALFLNLLNMSISAGWLVLAVLLFRIVLKKAPKTLRVVMWALVGIRLICPFSVESVLSLVPSAETLPADMLDSGMPAIQSGIPALNKAVNTIISENFTPDISGETAAVSPIRTVTRIAAMFWMIGVAAMLLYTLISYLRIAGSVREAVPAKGNVWLCDHISTPFILGILCPRIYLPSSIGEQDMEYVIAHENSHLKRRDHWWKALGFLILAIYWFNPLLWVAYALLCRDIELACDERVIRGMGAESKKPYSEALINCSVPRRAIAACPLAFGEIGVKGRIKAVLNYRKPAFWLVIVAVAVCAVTAVCFLTNPRRPKVTIGGVVIVDDQTGGGEGGNGTDGSGNDDSAQMVIKEPPVLTIHYMNGSVEAAMGNFTWNYAAGDATWRAMMACGAHPLEIGKQAEPMVCGYTDIVSSWVSSWAYNVMALNFEVMPDEIRVTCWNLAEDDPEGETVEVLNQEMMLRFGDYAYEIVAAWNSAEYYGQVSYVVRVIC